MHPVKLQITVNEIKHSGGPMKHRFSSTIVILGLLAGCSKNPSSVESNDYEKRLGALEKEVDNLSSKIEELSQSDSLTGDSDIGGSSTTLAESPETTVQSASLGTRAKPVPIGQTTDVGDGWTVRVNSANFDATESILAENTFNDPPAEGFVYVVVNVSVGYTGPDAKANTGVNFSGVGSSNVQYTTYDSFVVISDSYSTYVDVFAGGETTGNFALTVKESDVESLLIYASPFLSFQSDEVFFALR